MKRMLLASLLFIPLFSHAFEDDGSFEQGFFFTVYGTHVITGQGILTTAFTVTEACEEFESLSGRGNVYALVKGPLAVGCYQNTIAFSTNRWTCSESWAPLNCDSAEPTLPIDTYSQKAKGNPLCYSNDAFGNPISIATGNKFQQETILNRPFPLTLSYNSLDQQWRHSYAYALEVSGSSASLIRPDGKGLSFTEANGVWSADDGDVFYTLSAFDNGSGSAWKVTTQSGNEELYDDQGRVISITSLQGQSLTFAYNGSTTDISDEFGNVLSLTLDTKEHLSAVALNGVTQTTLTYDSEKRLISRTDAQNNTVQYHYEDTNSPNHLTGITRADGQRFATWAYDSEGRGILSEHAGQETAQLLFNEDGSTTITNSLGKQTTYHYEEIEGLKRPVQIEGHASENCVAANQAYTYNVNGLVETQTDWSGNITRFEYNDRGLVTRKTVAEGTAQERVTEQVWHETLPLLQQTQSAGRTTQYQYDAENRLISTEELSTTSP